MAAAVQLLPYQQAWARDQARFKIAMFARQTGKTFTTTWEVNDDCFEAAARGTRTRWVILSRGDRQAREAMTEGVQKHAKAYGAVIEMLEGEVVSEDGKRAYKTHEAVYPGGSRVIAVPANPDTARGFSANVLLDEFAFHQDSRKIWGALFPVVSAGYKLRVTSTPNGKGNKFYELMTAKPAAGKRDVWSRHIVDIYEAVRQGLPRDIDELRDGLNDADLWQQEYELKWLDEASSWLSYDLIDGVEHPSAGDPAGYQGGPCFVGNDIAVRGDLWVAWVYELVGDVLWTREVKTLKRAKFADQDAEMARIFRDYHVVRLAMDQTGMGEKPVEDATRRYGESRVTGVLFTAANKYHLAQIFKQRIEDRQLRIAAGDRLLRADLHAVRKTASPTGAVRLLADSDTDGHADRFWAGALGVEAAFGMDSVPMEYASSGRRDMAPAPPGLEAFQGGSGFGVGLDRRAFLGT